jgi:hypothetical protein
MKTTIWILSSCSPDKPQVFTTETAARAAFDAKGPIYPSLGEWQLTSHEIEVAGDLERKIEELTIELEDTTRVWD